MRQIVSKRLKELFPEVFWLYVDDGLKSKEMIAETKFLKEASMLIIYHIYNDGGFKSSDVPLPFLRRNCDVMTGCELPVFIRHLKTLNAMFAEEENFRYR